MLFNRNVHISPMSTIVIVCSNENVIRKQKNCQPTSSYHSFCSCVETIDFLPKYFCFFILSVMGPQLCLSFLFAFLTPFHLLTFIRVGKCEMISFLFSSCQLGPAKPKGEEFEKLDEVKFSTSNDSSSHETALLNGVSKSPSSKDETVTSMVPPQSSSSTSQHSRQSSLASSTASNEAKNHRITTGLGDCHKGLMVGLHRKMVNFSSHRKTRQILRPFHFTSFIIRRCLKKFTFCPRKSIGPSFSVYP